MKNQTWSELIKIVEGKKLNSRTWKSDQASLLDIFRYAEKNNIVPCEQSTFSLSKHRTIIKEAKQAKSKNNITRLAELFRLASTMSNMELRIALGITEPEEINVVPVVLESESMYKIILNKDQLDRIQKSCKQFYLFI